MANKSECQECSKKLYPNESVICTDCRIECEKELEAQTALMWAAWTYHLRMGPEGARECMIDTINTWYECELEEERKRIINADPNVN